MLLCFDSPGWTALSDETISVASSEGQPPVAALAIKEV
jgi:hypothetical protein